MERVDPGVDDCRVAVRPVVAEVPGDADEVVQLVVRRDAADRLPSGERRDLRARRDSVGHRQDLEPVVALGEVVPVEDGGVLVRPEDHDDLLRAAVGVESVVERLGRRLRAPGARQKRRRPDPRCCALDERASVETHTPDCVGRVNRIVTEPPKERLARSRTAYKPVYTGCEFVPHYRLLVADQRFSPW